MQRANRNQRLSRQKRQHSRAQKSLLQLAFFYYARDGHNSTKGKE
jgi:hypothetical protein